MNYRSNIDLFQTDIKNDFWAQKVIIEFSQDLKSTTLINSKLGISYTSSSLSIRTEICWLVDERPLAITTFPSARTVE